MFWASGNQGIFVERRIDAPSHISEIEVVLCPSNTFIFLWAFVQLAQMNILQMWQKEMAIASEQFWQAISLLIAFFIRWYTSISPLIKNTVGREPGSLPATATTLRHWGHSTFWSLCCCCSSCRMHPRQ